MKRLLKKFVRKFGVSLERVNIHNTPILQTLGCINSRNCNLVLDVGANEGQFALELLNNGFDKKIISFEPGKDAFDKLCRKSKSFENWFVAERAAVGSSINDLVLNVTKNSVSSSILNVTNLHIQTASGSNVAYAEKVKQVRLDKYLQENEVWSERIFLKVDTQGFEKQVLDGATGVLHQIEAIQIELSLNELYEGQLLWDEMSRYLISENYDLWGVQLGFHDPLTYQAHQFDGIFVRK